MFSVFLVGAGAFNSRKDRIGVEAGFAGKISYACKAFADPYKYVLSHDLCRDKACLVSTSDLVAHTKQMVIQTLSRVSKN